MSAVFGASALLVVAVVALFAAVARDQPAGTPPAHSAAEPLSRTLRGFADVLLAMSAAQVAGSFLMPVATGAIAGLFVQASSAYPPIAYRLIFAFMAAALAIGVAVYSRAKDSRPRAQSVRG